MALRNYKILGNFYNQDGTERAPYLIHYEHLDDALAFIKAQLDQHTPLGSIEVIKDCTDIAKVTLVFGSNPNPTKLPKFLRDYGTQAFFNELQAKWRRLVGM